MTVFIRKKPLKDSIETIFLVYQPLAQSTIGKIESWQGAIKPGMLGIKYILKRKNHMAEIYPSLLAADQQHLDKAVRQLEPVCPGFHIDIMDNTFVHNAGISIEKANSIAKLTYRQIWVHLMVEDPESYLGQLHLPPDSILTFHIESHKHSTNLIKKILEKKWLPSMAINPKTGIDEIFPFAPSLHQILIMSVEPGFGGQPFLEDTLSKVGPLVGFRTTARLNFKIAMDGGITLKNITDVANKGVDQLAVGSQLFEAKAGPIKTYELLAQRVE